MPSCVPVKDLRNTSAFLELVKNSADPITVTKNGYDEIVALRSKDYDELCHQVAQNRLLERMLIAEHERAEGKHVNAKEAISDIKARYGL